MRIKKVSIDVFYADESFVNIRRDEIDQLKERVENSSLKRNRLCVHRNIKNKIHEMFIVLLKGTYIMPAKHIDKTESLHVLEGRADAVFFDENGEISNIIHLGDYKTGLMFYYRMDDPIYHTLIVRSKHFVFQEVTQGPLNTKDTVFAPWAPKEIDKNAVRVYMKKLNKQVLLFESK